MILLIGGMGFIGLHTALHLVEAGHPVVITQYSTRRVPEALESHLDKDVFVERLDVTDAYNLFDVMPRQPEPPPQRPTTASIPWDCRT